MRYGRRRWVPAACPVCGSEPPPAPSVFSLAALLNNHLSGWKIYLVRKDPVWRVPQWYGYCNECAWQEALFTPPEKTILGRLKNDSDWKGGSISIPFKTKL